MGDVEWYGWIRCGSIQGEHRIILSAKTNYMKEWTKIFKALANENRLQILRVLAKHRELSVKMICHKLDKRVKMVSKHLGILSHMGFVEGDGKLGSVWYRLHPKLRPEIKYIINKFLK